ncbi:MAG: lysozyme, partial [Nitrococcus sp.]|nr:lysozyme [Nitrococcus sp.]
MRRPSPAAYDLIREFEGLRLHAYTDAVGVWTIGYGHTANVEPGSVIDSSEADALLRMDVREAEESIADHVPEGVIQSLPQACYDALVSFIFNVGTQAFVRPGGGKTDFIRALLGSDRAEVARQMQRWVKGRVSGDLIVLPGLVRRRGAEAALWGAGLHVGERAQPQAAHRVIAEAATVQPHPPRT